MRYIHISDVYVIKFYYLFIYQLIIKVKDYRDREGGRGRGEGEIGKETEI